MVGGCSNKEADNTAPPTVRSTTTAVPGFTATDLAAKAAAITDLLGATNWPAVRADFDATMTAQLSEAKLAEMWNGLVAQLGTYKSRGAPVETPKDNIHKVFDTPMQFERGEMKGRLAFNADGTIAGLFILVPNAP
jgi:Protein of unknown function (DUF3887)